MMTDADKGDFVKTLIGLAAVKPGKGLTSEAVELWWQTMRVEWSLQDFRQAAYQLNRTTEFMPSAFHFEQLRKASLPTAGEAFALAVKHAASSAYRTGPLGDECIDAAVRSLGGYVVIAMCEEDKLPFLERRFSEHYETISDAQQTRAAVPTLTAPQRPKLQGPQPIGALMAQIPERA